MSNHDKSHHNQTINARYVDEDKKEDASDDHGDDDDQVDKVGNFTISRGVGFNPSPSV